jgi:integrase
MKLTLDRVRALVCPPGRKDQSFPFDDGVIVRAGKAAVAGSLAHKVYYTRYSVNGVKRWLRLGPCDVLSAADAIKAAKAARGDVARQRDPFAERQEKAQAGKLKAARDALTVDAVIDRWAALKLTTKSKSYADTAPRSLRNLLGAKLRALPAVDLSRSLIVQAHDRLAERAPIMAARAVNYGNACWSWAIRRGMLALTVNPFAELEVAPTTRRERVLSDDELRAVWTATEGAGLFNVIVRMLILTGQRREEVGGMRHDELSPDLAAWTIPAARTKNRKTHIVRSPRRRRRSLRRNRARPLWSFPAGSMRPSTAIPTPKRPWTAPAA